MRSYKEDSGSKFGFRFRATKRVGNDSSQHLKMFGEVSKPLSAEMNEIWLINQTSEIVLALVYSYYYRKIPIFQFPLIITCPVSYEVDKAYKVILGLIFEALRQILPFDRMRKTDM